MATVCIGRPVIVPLASLDFVPNKSIINQLYDWAFLGAKGLGPVDYEHRHNTEFDAEFHRLVKEFQEPWVYSVMWSMRDEPSFFVRRIGEGFNHAKDESYCSESDIDLTKSIILVQLA